MVATGLALAQRKRGRNECRQGLLGGLGPRGVPGNKLALCLACPGGSCLALGVVSAPWRQCHRRRPRPCAFRKLTQHALGYERHGARDDLLLQGSTWANCNQYMELCLRGRVEIGSAQAGHSSSDGNTERTSLRCAKTFSHTDRSDERPRSQSSEARGHVGDFTSRQRPAFRAAARRSRLMSRP